MGGKPLPFCSAPAGGSCRGRRAPAAPPPIRRRLGRVGLGGNQWEGAGGRGEFESAHLRRDSSAGRDLPASPRGSARTCLPRLGPAPPQRRWPGPSASTAGEHPARPLAAGSGEVAGACGPRPDAPPKGSRLPARRVLAPGEPPRRPGQGSRPRAPARLLGAGPRSSRGLPGLRPTAGGEHPSSPPHLGSPARTAALSRDLQRQTGVCAPGQRAACGGGGRRGGAAAGWQLWQGQDCTGGQEERLQLPSQTGWLFWDPVVSMMMMDFFSPPGLRPAFTSALPWAPPQPRGAFWSWHLPWCSLVPPRRALCPCAMADSSPVQGASAGAWWKALTSKKNAKQAPLPSLPPAPSSPDPRDQQPPQCSSEPKAADKPGGGGGSRRNLHVSRSGRFKERRKVHAPLLAESPALFEGSAPSRAAQQSQ